MGAGHVPAQDNLSWKPQGQNLRAAVTAEPQNLLLALCILVNTNTGCLQLLKEGEKEILEVQCTFHSLSSTFYSYIV